MVSDCGDHFVIYKNIESLCCAPENNIVLQVIYTSKNKEQKRDQICGCHRWGIGMGKGELDESGQKVQTSSYEINKYQGYNVNK